MNAVHADGELSRDVTREHDAAVEERDEALVLLDRWLDSQEPWQHEIAGDTIAFKERVRFDRAARARSK